jgi:hypothetical protein
MASEGLVIEPLADVFSIFLCKIADSERRPEGQEQLSEAGEF